MSSRLRKITNELHEYVKDTGFILVVLDSVSPPVLTKNVNTKLKLRSSRHTCQGRTWATSYYSGLLLDTLFEDIGAAEIEELDTRYVRNAVQLIQDHNRRQIPSEYDAVCRCVASEDRGKLGIHQG